MSRYCLLCSFLKEIDIIYQLSDYLSCLERLTSVGQLFCADEQTDGLALILAHLLFHLCRLHLTSFLFCHLKQKAFFYECWFLKMHASSVFPEFFAASFVVLLSDH